MNKNLQSTIAEINLAIERWAQHLLLEINILEGKTITISISLHPDLKNYYSNAEIYQSLSEELSHSGYKVIQQEKALMLVHEEFPIHIIPTISSSLPSSPAAAASPTTR